MAWQLAGVRVTTHSIATILYSYTMLIYEYIRYGTEYQTSELAFLMPIIVLVNTHISILAQIGLDSDSIG